MLESTVGSRSLQGILRGVCNRALCAGSPHCARCAVRPRWRPLYSYVTQEPIVQPVHFGVHCPVSPR
eukprot:1132972-Lingulodinium_polyedra.AAC.1